MIWPLQSEADAFYGDPRGAGDEANPKWVADNLVKVACPWKLNNSAGAGSFTIHRKCAASLTRVLNAIWEGAGRSQERINALRYNVFDGSYNYRNKRGGTSLSMHAYGAAIDWDAKDNEQHSQAHLFTADSPLVVEFEREGWIWGGRWSPGSIDAMHVQAARVHGDSVSKPGDLRDHPPPLSTYPPTLQLGSRGDDVRRVQQLLLVDGIYGEVTKQAVVDFQDENGFLVADGVVGPETWKALLKIAPLPTPVVPPTAPPSLHLTGKCSWFGGPLDTGVTPSEGLAFIDAVNDQPTIFLPEQPPGTTGLARRLDPAKFFIACRWAYDKPYQSKTDLLKHKARVRASKTGLEFEAWPADWGPNEATGRIADLSHGLMTALGITTDDTVEVVYPSDIPPIVVATVPSTPPAAPKDWRDFDIWGWLKSMLFSNQGK